MMDGEEKRGKVLRRNACSRADEKQITDTDHEMVRRLARHSLTRVTE